MTTALTILEFWNPGKPELELVNLTSSQIFLFYIRRPYTPYTPYTVGP